MIRSNVLTSLLMALFLGMAMVPRGTHAFVPTSFQSQRSISLAAAEDEGANAFPEELAAKPVVKCPDCDQCDGSGRIEGGIGVVLKFWPIKAYRPCPVYIERGGAYQRQGQGLDEIAFGRKGNYDPMDQ